MSDGDGNPDLLNLSRGLQKIMGTRKRNKVEKGWGRPNRHRRAAGMEKCLKVHSQKLKYVLDQNPEPEASTFYHDFATQHVTRSLENVIIR